MSTTHPSEDALLQRLTSRTATVGVVGLGYVGLPLVRAMHEAGFRVVGFDIDPQKVRMLRAGEAYLRHLGEDLPRRLAASDRFLPTSQPADLASCDAIVLCVPTPLGAHMDPDLSFVVRSTEMVASILKPGALVVLESTSYPGTTREVCLPILQRGTGGASLRQCGSDFFLAFSPEREDPGRRDHETRTIPRLVGGIDAPSLRCAHALYSQAVNTTIPVSSAEVAEAAKLLENIYRAVNIALVNELKPVLGDMGIDIWEVIAAASTKPFGFQPFHPGPGLGGHCIPIDPYYLTYKAREFGHVTRFIELAGEINRRMPALVVDRLAAALNDQGRSVKNARLLVLGIAYKPDVDDVRETPAAEIIELLLSRGGVVSYHDPHVATFPRMKKYALEMQSVPLSPQTLAQTDAVLIVTNHSSVDYALVGEHARLIIDTRNAMARVPSPRARVVKA
jgi:UDP-N-acetyl-D-glucosamine dehydrogenase